MSGGAPVAPGPVPGLFGKLPAHGDFVGRGWPDATIAAVDRWLSAGMVAMRSAGDDATLAASMRAAPMWEAYVPAGLLGPLALRVMLAASIDRAGRLFPLVAGVAGGTGAVWGHGRATADVGAAMYDAVAGRLDADAMLVRLRAVAGDGGAGGGEGAPPAVSVWWPASVAAGEEPPPLDAAHVDAALLERLMGTQRA